MMLAPLLAFIILFLADTAQKVEVTRFSDRVTVTNSRTGEETVLFYNNKLAILEEKDRVEQGSGAISVCRFEDDSRIRFFSRARYRFGELSKEKHLILVDDFTRIKVLANDNVSFHLPGGTKLSARNSDIMLEQEENWIHVRNEGPMDIQVSGHLVPEADETIPPGHHLSIPLYDPELKGQMEPIVVREVAGMIVKTTGGYRFEERPGFIRVSRPGTEDGIACIGGARILLDPGETMILTLRQRR